jgi:hypothetical protein
MTYPRWKQAVFIVTTPPDFKPQRPWDVPPSFAVGTLYAKNLSIREAVGFARTFNKRAVQARERHQWDHRWAILSKHLRPHRRWQQAQTESEKGGAECEA